MAKRLQETEKLIEELRANNRDDTASTEGDHHTSASVEQRDDNDEVFRARLANRQALAAVSSSDGGGGTHQQRGDELQTRTPESSIGAASGVFAAPSKSITAVTEMPAPPWLQVPTHAPPSDAGSRELPHAAPELTVDEHGRACYYGPTSAVHDPPTAESPASTSAQTYVARPSAAWTFTHPSLVSCVREMATWEEFALGNASLQTGIPRQIMAKLLHLYWTWVSPMFMWVFRPAFIRRSPPTTGIWREAPKLIITPGS